jgi:hypothetical protein
MFLAFGASNDVRSDCHGEMLHEWSSAYGNWRWPNSRDRG